MSRVFIPQLPSRFDTTINSWVPTVDIESAKKFGETVVMLPPEASRLDTLQVIDLLIKAMESFEKDDYVLALGDPLLIGVTCMLADRAVAPVKMLRWDRRGEKYQSISISLGDDE